MRIGIFGGTFDPIHLGHLVLAEQCREQCQLDEVWFVPAAHPPHKLDATISAAKVRCEMIELAISGSAAFRLNRMELERTGPSYTFETLEQFHRDDPTRELFLMIGADSLRELPSWREPQRILELATIAAVNRGDRPLEDRMDPSFERLRLLPCFRLVQVQMPGVSISATDIRHRVASGRSIRYLVPRAVETYIQQQKLFMPQPTAGCDAL